MAAPAAGWAVGWPGTLTFGEVEDAGGEEMAEGGVVDLVLVVVGAQEAVEAVHLVVQGHGAAGRAAYSQRVDVLLVTPVGDVLPDGAALPTEAFLPHPLGTAHVLGTGVPRRHHHCGGGHPTVMVPHPASCHTGCNPSITHGRKLPCIYLFPAREGCSALVGR